MKQTVEEAARTHWSESTYNKDAELAYDERELNDDEIDRAVEESAKRHYSDLCALNHSLRFKMPNEYNDDNWGFYCKECKDYEEI